MAVQRDAKGHFRSAGPADYYQLLQLDPDAPHELVVEAYWYLTAKVRAEDATWESAQQRLYALNAAYAVIGLPERRAAFDTSFKRLVERRRAREAQIKAERLEAARPTPFLERFFGKPPDDSPDPGPPDYYELLGVDPGADLELVARAHTILQARSAKGATATLSEHRAYLEEAYFVLIDGERRAAYDLQRQKATTEQAVPPATAGNAAIKPSKEPARPAKEAPAAPSADAVEPEQGMQETEEKGRRQWPTLQELLGVLLRASIVWGHRALHVARRAAHLGYEGAAWIAPRAIRLAKAGGQATIRLAKASARAAARWRQRRREGREATPADLVDQRLLRDAVPAHFRARRKAPDGEPCRARLVVEGPSGENKVVTLNVEPVTLGSDPACEVPLEPDGESVAAAHAQLWFADGRFIIRSMSPQHPTLVAGQTVNWAVLDDGDEIAIGQCRIRFEAAAPEDNPPDYLKTEQLPTGSELLERHD